MILRFFLELNSQTTEKQECKHSILRSQNKGRGRENLVCDWQNMCSDCVGNEWTMGSGDVSVFETRDLACVSGLWQPSQEKACFGSPVSLCLNHTGLLTVLIWYSQLVKRTNVSKLESKESVLHDQGGVD